MKLSDFSIRHRVAAFVLIAGIALLGTVSYVSLPRESTPDIKVPLVTVAIPYPEAAPEDVEREVTLPLERELESVKGLSELSSISVEGMSVTTIEFQSDVDVQEALQRVRDKFDKAKADFPSDVEEESIDELSFSEFPIMILTLYGDDVRVLQRVAEKLEDRIETIPGVLAVDIAGGLEPQIEIEIDPEKLEAYSLPVNELIERLRGENTTVSAGAVDAGDMKPTVRVPGEFKTAEDINSLIVHEVNGKPVYLRDVATASLSTKDPTSYTRRDGRQAVSVSISKRAGSNAIWITDAVKKGLKEYKSELPAGVDYAILTDESDQIKSMVSDLENNILSGLVLVLLVVLLALGARNAMFVSIAIPLSLGISFVVLQMIGFTLNTVVLFSLILAQGMLVDNAIVIIENIYRHIGLGKSPVKAAMDGTAEVAWPVITATATTVGAFAPMAFWPGIMGEFMSFLPITVIITLVCSLFVALVINPAMAAALMRYRKPKQTGYGRMMERFGDGVLNVYERTLNKALRFPKLSVLAGFVVLIGVTVLYGFLGLGVEVFPETEPKLAYVNITAPEGTSLDKTDALAKAVEARLPANADVKGIETTVGGVGGSDPMANGADASNKARVLISFHDQDQRTGSPLGFIDQIRPIMKDLPGAEFEIAKQSMGPPSGPPINVEVSVANEEDLVEAVGKVRAIVERVPGVTEVRDDMLMGKPEYRIRVDRQKAALLGLNTQFIGSFVGMFLNGRQIGTWDDGTDDRDIVAILPRHLRNDPAVLDRIKISDPRGNAIPLSTVCSWDYVGGSGTVRRKEGRRIFTVMADAAPGYNADAVLQDVRQAVETEATNMPAGFEVRYTGENKDKEEATAFLSKAFMFAVLVVFLILVLEFNSVLQAFIILFSVILSLMGVLISLIVLHQPFGIIMTGVAVVALAGVVVNNAIVMIDYINQLRERLPLKEAIVEAGRTRLRPVMLTAITTTLGLLPMAARVSFDFKTFGIIVGGDSSAWWAPLATAVIFGLMISTVLTLVLVPAFYYLFDGWGSKFQKSWRKFIGNPDKLAPEQIAEMDADLEEDAAEEEPSVPMLEPEPEPVRT